jgi:spermidine/putrescine ABC transporter ATP-binding subunit
MATVRLENVSKCYDEMVALHPLTLDVADGEFITLLGPSGCGKTTMLRIVAGLGDPTSGRVEFGGTDVTRLAPQKRGIGMVFQDYALFPHLTIAENIAFGLRERRYATRFIQARVKELLELIKLPAIAERLPSEISGGQQQRVAFARAIAHPPQVLLMDEPLGALDLKLREAMQLELRQMQRQLGITTMYVTHDQSEAMCLSNRIAVMNNGSIEQIGTSREIYDRPKSRFVAQFIGQINLIPAEPVGKEGDFEILKLGAASVRAPATAHSAAGRRIVAVRPHHVAITNGSGIPPGHNRLSGIVRSQIFNGNVVQVQVEVNNEVWAVEARPSISMQPDGAMVTLHWDPENSILLDE